MMPEFDETVNFRHSLFLRPGMHFFYFVRGGKYFMLSQMYPTEQYKQTNVIMNYIKVEARDWRICRPMIDRDAEWKEIVHFSEGDEETFDFKKSVFRNFKLDTP